MGDVGDDFRAMKAHRRDYREKAGLPCPECRRLQPKRDASILLPGQRCRVDGYRDPRNASDRQTTSPEVAPPNSADDFDIPF